MKRASHKKGTDDCSSEPKNKATLPGNDTLGFQVLRLARWLQGDFLQKIRRTGLSPAQTIALAELSRSQGLPQSELARRLEIGKAAVGQTLDKLESSGHIVRARNALDRRTVLVTLTPKGESAVDLIAEASQGQLTRMKEQLGGELVEQLTALVMRANATCIDGVSLDIVE